MNSDATKTSDSILSVRDLKVHFAIRQGIFQRKVGTVRAVDGIGFDIGRSETVGLVGESGCGKSTTGLALAGLVNTTHGEVVFDGIHVGSKSGRDLAAYRRKMQIVFQDPFSSLNPRQRVLDILRAPLDIHGIGSRTQRRQKVLDMMEKVGLRPDQAVSFPHQFSGGQRQRIGIARALMLNPDIIVCVEPVSALDVSVQAQILNLLNDLQKELGVSYFFISHDLGVVEHISHKVAVMYLGRIVEMADRKALFAGPTHPYTKLLLNSTPSLNPRKRRNFSASSDDISSDPSALAGVHLVTDARLRAKSALPKSPLRPHVTAPAWSRATTNRFKDDTTPAFTYRRTPS